MSKNGPKTMKVFSGHEAWEVDELKIQQGA